MASDDDSDVVLVLSDEEIGPNDSVSEVEASPTKSASTTPDEPPSSKRARFYYVQNEQDRVNARKMMEVWTRPFFP
jgi:hypothetical protein